MWHPDRPCDSQQGDQNRPCVPTGQDLVMRSAPAFSTQVPGSVKGVALRVFSILILSK